MSNRPRFGPAGIPHMFRQTGAKLTDVPKLLRTEDLNAFEYAAVRWGQVPQIKREDAKRLRAEAEKNDVMLSVHGSYFINLFGENEVAEASKRRIVAAATAADWMGAYIVVFHAGFYGKNGKAETLKKAVKTLREVANTLKSLGIENLKLGPETMGRHSQFGTLEEIMNICQEVDQTHLVIDWSHLHARSGGRLRTVDDFRKIVLEVENKLGIEAVRNMHCHFSKIEYTYKSGERRHHVLDEAGYGPDFEMLAQIITEFKMSPVIICETAVQDIDAMKMKKIYQTLLEKAKLQELP
jgi:deoxyribonuclease-4